MTLVHGNTPVENRSLRAQASVLVLAGTLTIMAGATVAPAIPGIRTAFSGVPDVDFLTRMITTSHAIAIVIVAPFAGIVGQRVGRKKTLVAGMAIFAIGGSSGVYLPNLTTVLIGRAVLGIGVALVMANGAALIADLYDGAKRQKLLGWQSAAGAFGGVILLVGGGALAALGWRVVFLVYLLGALLIIPTLLFVTTPAPTPPGPARRSTSWWVVPRSLAAALAAMMLGQVAFYSVPVQVPFLVEDHFGGTALMSGAIIAVQTFATGVVATRFSSIRRLAGARTLVSAAFMAIGTGYVVLWLAPDLIILVGGMVVMGAGLGVLMPNVMNWVLGDAGPRERGRYTGLLTTALFLGQFLAPLVTQPIVTHIGIQPTFAVIAAGALTVAAAYGVAAIRMPPACNGPHLP